MCSQLEKQPARFKNVNCRITIRPGSSPAKYKLQRNENIHSLKNLCMGIHSNFIHNRQMQKQHKCSSTDEGINVYSVSQLCPTLCNPIDASLPGSSIHGIVQARILEWDAIPYSRGSSQPRDWTHVSYTVGRFFNTELLGKPLEGINKMGYIHTIDYIW